mmetsp:Transcript_1169/g.2430  ORF Transcript_1169/g.2430 Transcript_1169/m.2430 type:complete len:1060 (+) Transcript_1169:445-3624(+)
MDIQYRERSESAAISRSSFRKDLLTEFQHQRSLPTSFTIANPGHRGPLPLSKPAELQYTEAIAFEAPNKESRAHFVCGNRQKQAINRVCRLCLEAAIRLEQAVREAESYRENCSNLLYASCKIQNVMEWLLQNDIRQGAKYLIDICERVLSSLEIGVTRTEKYGKQSGCVKFLWHRNGKRKLNETKKALESLAVSMEAVLDNMEDMAGNNLAASYKLLERTIKMPRSMSRTHRESEHSKASEKVLIKPSSGELNERKRIHRGKLIKVRCLGYQSGSHKLWWCTRLVENKMRNAICVFDLLYQKRFTLEASIGCSKVFCFHIDTFGNMWTGHMDGEVRVWDMGGKLMYSKEVCNSALTAIHTTTTEVWMGSSKGNMRTMRWTDDGRDRKTAELEAWIRLTNSEGRRPYNGPLWCMLQQHNQPRWIWSAGGTGRSSIRVWCPTTYKNVFTPLTDISLGEARCLADMELESHGVLMTVIASAHESGQVVLWESKNAVQLRLLGCRCSPCRALNVGKGMMITGHKDGMMRMWRLQPVEAIFEQPLSAIAHRTCVLCIIHTADGIMTSTNFGTIRFWPLLDIETIFQEMLDPQASAGTYKKPFQLRSNSTICLTSFNIPDRGEEVDMDEGVDQPVSDHDPDQSQHIETQEDLPLQSSENSPSGLPTSSHFMVNSNQSDNCWQPPFLANSEAKMRLAAPLHASLTPSAAKLSSDVIACTSGAQTGDHALSCDVQADKSQQSQENRNLALSVLGENHSFEVEFSELVFSKNIGQGSFGQVYKGIWRASDVAIKVLTLSETGHAKEMAAFKKEVALLASLRSPNVVMFMGAYVNPPNLGMVMEFCGRGSLYDLLEQQREARHKLRGKHLPWARRLQIALDVAVGMTYLHTCNPAIVHRDLKSPNIMICSNWQAKIGDLGMSQIMEYSCIAGTASIYSPRWMAPEILKGANYDISSDIYSFGVILWELCTLEVPWADCVHPFQLVHQVVTEGKKLEIHVTSEHDFRGLLDVHRLIEECCTTDPSVRPPFNEIVDRLRKLVEETTRNQQRQRRQTKAENLPPEDDAAAL